MCLRSIFSGRVLQSALLSFVGPYDSQLPEILPARLHKTRLGSHTDSLLGQDFAFVVALWKCFRIKKHYLILLHGSFILWSSWVELSSKRENQFFLSCCCCLTDAFRMPPHPPLAQIPVVFLNSSLKSLTGPQTIFSLFKSSCVCSWEDSGTLRVKLQ